MKGLYIILIILSVFLLYKNIENFSIREENDIKIDELKEHLRPLIPNIDNMKIFKGKKSYSINKEKIFLCLKDKDGNYYDMNILVSVILHEVAHVYCNEIGHTEKFHNIYKDLLKQAEYMGLYDPNAKIPDNSYCNY